METRKTKLRESIFLNHSPKEKVPFSQYKEETMWSHCSQFQGLRVLVIDKESSELRLQEIICRGYG